MKKILTAFFVLSVAVAGVAAALMPVRMPFYKDKAAQALASANDKAGISAVAAKSAYLIDESSGTVLYSQNETAHFPIASMCKIMALNIIFDYVESGEISLDCEIIVSETAMKMGGSQVFLQGGDFYKAGELIKSVIVASANDATVALAERIAGEEDAFVALMNQKAKELGMNDTNFSNSTGLPKAGQYSCAKDVAIMTRELLKHGDYYKYSTIWMDNIRHKEGRITEISNTNKLVRFYQGCDGGKTGYTSEAKHCVSATAVRDGLRLVSVIIGADDSKVRFSEASRLLNHGFANYTSKQIVFKDKPIDLKVRLRGGAEKNFEVAPSSDYKILSGKTEKKQHAVEYNLSDSIKAPVKKGDKAGTMSVIIDNKIVTEIDLIACKDVDKISYGGVIADIIEAW